MQINKKSIAKGDVEFNPFKYGVNDTALITLNTVFLNTIAFNRLSTKWGIDITNLNNSGKSLLTYGYESRKVNEWTAKLRWNLSKSFSINVNGIKEMNALYTPSVQFDNRNYQLDIKSLRPILFLFKEHHSG